MSGKAKKLLDNLILSMQRNGWSDDDIKDILGKTTIHPKSFGLAMLFRIAELYSFWLILRAKGGIGKDVQVVSDIEDLTLGGKARRREERSWNSERMKVYAITKGRSRYGPVDGIPNYNIQFSTCNLRCKDCHKKETWTEGSLMSSTTIMTHITKGYSQENILTLSGGEPLLWQDKVSMVRMLYKFAIGNNHQVHLETNGTILPRKMVRDVFGIITIVLKLKDHGDFDFWQNKIDIWEDISPPIWAPILSEDDEKNTNEVWELFHGIDGNRIFPRPKTFKDRKYATAVAIGNGWMMNDCIR